MSKDGLSTEDAWPYRGDKLDDASKIIVCNRLKRTLTALVSQHACVIRGFLRFIGKRCQTIAQQEDRLDRQNQDSQGWQPDSLDGVSESDSELFRSD